MEPERSYGHTPALIEEYETNELVLQKLSLTVIRIDITAYLILKYDMRVPLPHLWDFRISLCVEVDLDDVIPGHHHRSVHIA